MADDPRAVGAELRAAVEKSAAAAAEATVRAIMDSFGEGIRAAGVQAAAVAAQKATSDFLKGLDLTEAKAAYEAVREEQDRLREGRDRLAEDLHKARLAEGELRALAAQLLQARLDQEATTVAVAKAIGDLRADLDLRAGRLVAIALEGNDELIAAAITKCEEAVAAAVAKCEEAVAKAALRRWRGPYKEGDVYEAGDLAAFFGSTFLAVRKTSDRPLAGTPDTPWQLFAAGGYGDGVRATKHLESRIRLLETAAGG